VSGAAPKRVGRGVFLSIGSALRSSWLEWAERTCRVAARGSTPAGTWTAVISGTVVLGVIGLGSFYPSQAPLLAADGWWGAALAIIGFVTVTHTTLRVHAEPLASSSGIMAQGLTGNLLFHGGTLFLVDRAADSVTRTLLYVVFAFIVTSQAFQMRVSFRPPWFFLPTTVSFVIVGCVAHQGPALPLLTALWIFPACVVLGEGGRRFDTLLEDEGRRRAEHDATLLAIHERENAQLADFLERVAGRTHDLAGPALALTATLDRLVAVAEGESAVLARQAQADAEALMGLIRDAKSDLRGSALPPSTASSVAPVLDAVALRMRARFPADVRTSPRPAQVSVDVRGGTLALTRVIDNLAANACQVARHVLLDASSIDDQVHIVVDDDGPGFVETVALAGSGLASVRRIVETSGGQLTFERSSLGGTRALVRLPQTPDT